MIPMSGRGWPDSVPLLTLAELQDGSVVNLIGRAGQQVVYLQYSPAGGGAAPELSVGRAHVSGVRPVQRTLVLSDGTPRHRDGV